MIVSRIRREIPLGTIIPKPGTNRKYTVKAWRRRRGEDALIYLIPNRNDPGNPYEKGITVSEWRQAYRRIQENGELSRQWFNDYMQPCAKEGSCNFTTIGGIFELLGYAAYHRGVYQRTGSS